MIKTKKLHMIYSTFFVAAILPISAYASDKNNSHLTNHLYEEGYGEVEKNTPKDNDDFNKDNKKFRAKGKFSKVISLGYANREGAKNYLKPPIKVHTEGSR